MAAGSEKDDIMPGAPRTIELICGNGHVSVQSLERVLRLNDGWCGKCGANVKHDPQPLEDGPLAAVPTEGSAPEIYLHEVAG
jgi:hypothetical protein